jgi:hypothetical protein
MLPQIRTEQPYEDLKRDSYSHHEVFDPSVDFKVMLIEERRERDSLVFKKKYDGVSGYALVICKDEVVSRDHFQDSYNQYTECVRRYGDKSFKEVELILIARDFENDVADFVETYNNLYRGRKAIRLYQY